MNNDHVDEEGGQASLLPLLLGQLVEFENERRACLLVRWYRVIENLIVEEGKLVELG